MTRRQPNKLTAYRRHADKCAAKGKENPQLCQCPMWCHGRIGGKFIRRRLDTRSYEEARRKCDDVIAGRASFDVPVDAIHIVGGAAAKSITIEEAERHYLAAKNAEHVATSTIEAYSHSIARFRQYAERMGIVKLGEVTPALISTYMLANQINWKSQRTRLTHMTFLTAFFRHCQDFEWIAKVPTAKKALKIPRPSDHAREPFTTDEVARILAAVEQLPAHNLLQGRALVNLLLYSGMRISDASYIERGAIDTEGFLSYITIKTKTPVEVYLHLAAREALAALPATRVYFFQPDRTDQYTAARRALRAGKRGGRFNVAIGKTEYTTTLQRMARIVASVLEIAGVSGRCHRFRDTFAITLLAGNADIFKVSKALGHSDVSITQRHYLNFIPGYRRAISEVTRGLSYHLPPVAV